MKNLFFILCLFISSTLLFGQEPVYDGFGGTATGTNSQVSTIGTIIVTSPYDKQLVWIKSASTNTGAATLKINNFSAAGITLNGNALTGGEIPPNVWIGYKYDLTSGKWQMQKASGGTVTSVSATSPLSSSGGATPTITITSPLPIANGGTNTTLGITVNAGSDISIGGTYPTYSVINTAPDQTVTITGAGTTTVSGTYPTYTITGAATPTVTAGNWAILGNAGTVDGTNFIGTTDNVDFNIRVNDTLRVKVDTIGRVGIGVSAPTATLHLWGSGNTKPNFLMEHSGASTGSYMMRFSNTGGTGFEVDDRGYTYVGNMANQNDLYPLGVEAQFKVLNIFDIAYTGDESFAILANPSGGSRGYLVAGTSRFDIGSITANKVGFFTNSLERIRILSTGEVGIGTLSASAKLDVVGTGSTSATYAARFSNSVDTIFEIRNDRRIRYDDGNQAASKVLTSDANGVATWAAPVTSATAWQLLGNAGTVDGTNFIGTTDDIPFNIRVNNQKAGRIDHIKMNSFFGYQSGNSTTTGEGNTAAGFAALSANSTGTSNTATGVQALFSNNGNNNTATGRNSLYSNTTGNYNTANGVSALYFNTTGSYNTANGTHALYSNTTGSRNTSTGDSALYSNTTGINNTASGRYALFNNTTGGYNTAIGLNAFLSNVAGSNATAIGYSAMAYANNTATPFSNYNVAIGYQTLRGSTTAANNTGIYNTGVGSQSLYSNTTGSSNAGVGLNALFSNTTGSDNTANGAYALYNNTTGNENTAIGTQASFTCTTGSYNTAVGLSALYYNSTGNYNTALGRSAGNAITTGSNNTAIGYNAQVPVATNSNQVRIGDAAITYAGVQVAWTITSDKRWKTDIQSSNLGLDFISKLKPVSYIRNNDKSKKREYGFIAQELEETLNGAGAADNGIISRDDQGMYSLRYNDLMSPLVKAIQEINKKLETENANLANEVKNLKDKFSAEIEKIKQEIGMGTEAKGILIQK